MAETLELLTRRADLAPATADREARTVEVIWSTGAPVRRRDMAGEYIERLRLDAAAVDLSRLKGASVLDAHRQSAVRDVLGSVREASVDGNRPTLSWCTPLHRSSIEKDSGDVRQNRT